MDRTDIIGGAFWLAFSVFCAVLSYQLGLGRLNQPGPGFFFFWTAIVTAVLSAIVLLKGFKKEAAKEKREPVIQKENIVKVILVLAALFCYALMVELIGFIILTFLLFVFLLAFIEKKKWSVSVLIGIAVTVLSYLLFETALQSQLPKGLLESLRF
jgi:putative tricarboxylic transport membrane protein